MELKRVVITGPTGAVGCNLINELTGNGISVTAVCREGSEHIANLPKSDLLTVVECNLDNISKLSDRLNGEYDAFYHFAWDGPFGDARRDLRKQTCDVLYTIDAVEAASEIGCKVFVGAGSQSEFGHVDGVLKPDMPCNPVDGYGNAKLTAGRLSRIRCKELGIRHEWGRIVSMYGPYDRKYTMVMSSILKMLSGERVKFTKGEQIWDYIYAKDAARAFRLMAERGKDGEVYLLGTGSTRQLKDYITIIRDAVNPDLDIGIGEIDYYPNQAMHLEADISNLVRDTGFTPSYTFEEGIKETVKWVKDSGYLNTSTLT